MKPNKAFTLIEVLIVLTLTGLTFSILLLIFSRGISSSLNLSQHSESLKSEVSLFWDIERKIIGAKRIKVEKDRIYMITSSGSFYEGVVKCAYLYKNGRLYYYEFPYPYGAIDIIDEKNLYEIGRFENFKVSVIENNREFKAYDGMPQFVKVVVNSREFLFETIR